MERMEILLELIGTEESFVVKAFAVIGILWTSWFLEKKFKSLFEENKKKK